MTNREYYREKFASDLADMLAADPEGLGKLAIFKYLYPSSEEVTIGIDSNTGLPITKEVWGMSMQDIGGMDADTKEEIRESWAYLMEVKDDGYFDSVDMANLGRDLFMYCFYQLGFDFSPISFMHLAPTAVKDSIIVERSQNLPIKSWEGEIKPNSDDVYVWSPSVIGGAEKASDDFGANVGYVGELSGNSFQMPDVIKYQDWLNLIHEAKSHPELKFKIARNFTQAEFDMLANKMIGEDIPSNIYFSSETLAIVTPESKEAISYGRSRTYRQFLNEILDGSERGLNEDEFAQMWILNHLDNTRFVLDTNLGNKRLSQIIGEIIAQDGNTLREGMTFRKYITIDISKYQNEQDMAALSNLVSLEIKDKKIAQATWCPCIKINGSYYIAQSGTDLGFNVNAGLTMTYMKVEPWGSSKTIEYDGNQKLTPQMRYQTSMFAEPERVENYDDDTPIDSMTQTIASNSEPYTDASNSEGVDTNMTRQQMEDYIFDEFIKAVEAKNGSAMPAEDKQSMRAMLSQNNDADLATAVQMIKQACRKNGVMMLDDEGNPMQGC